MRPSKKDLATIIPVAHFPPGGAKGMVTVEKCRIIERETGLSIPDLFPVAVGDSVGGIIAGCLYFKDAANPDQPKFTANRFADLFHDSLPVFINIPRLHLLKHVFHFAAINAQRIGPVRWGAERLKTLYNDTARKQGWAVRDFNIDKWLVVDRSGSENILRAHLGPASMGDLLGTVVIGSRVIYPRITTFDFVKIDYNLFDHERILAPLCSMPDAPLIDAIMGSSAVPTFFPMRPIHSTGHVHHDGVGFRNHTHTLMNLEQAMPEGHGLAYALMGIFEHNPRQDRGFLDPMNLFDIQDLIGMFSGAMHDRNTREDFFKSLEILTGGLTFDLSTPFGPLSDGRVPSQSPLNARKDQIDRLVASVHEDFDARRDEYMRVIDFVVEAREARLAKQPSPAFLSRLERERSDGYEGRLKVRQRSDGFLEPYMNGPPEGTPKPSA